MERRVEFAITQYLSLRLYLGSRQSNDLHAWRGKMTPSVFSRVNRSSVHISIVSSLPYTLRKKNTKIGDVNEPRSIHCLCIN